MVSPAFRPWDGQKRRPNGERNCRGVGRQVSEHDGAEKGVGFCLARTHKICAYHSENPIRRPTL